MFFTYAFFFALGAIVASFVGVIAARLNTGSSILTGRSHCDACGMLLSPAALVPIFSYVVSGGRAQCCHARISIVSPLTEVLLGGLFVGAYLKIGLTPALPFALLALSVLLALVMYDLAHQILPPTLLTVFVTSAAATAFLSAASPADFLQIAGWSVATASILLLIHLFSRGRAMGFSDAPLVFGLSLFAGPEALAGFVFSFWIGAVIGIFILAQRPRGSRMGVEVPFAPFLAAGFLLAYFTQWNPFIFAGAIP